MMRVLVADDSVIFRKVISEALSGVPDVEVVGTASNGRLALQKVAELKPDLLTLDIEMPQMDGLAVLDALKQAGGDTEVIVVSALTRFGGDLTMKALAKGAFDFITKPEGAGSELSRKAITDELAPRVKAISRRREIRRMLRSPGSVPKPPAPPSPEPGTSARLSDIAGRMAKVAAPGKPELVLIGVSTGGPNALARLLPALPGDLGVPVFIVQHMPPIFTRSLAESLSGKCRMPVREASHHEKSEPNMIYIAPGGKQMRLAASADVPCLIEITDDPPENNCRPAVDYLFRSAANHFPGKALGVILTGMGSDGTLGLKLLKRHGSFVIAQDEATSVVYGMPKAAFEAGVVDTVLPIDAIGQKIVSTVRGTG